MKVFFYRVETTLSTCHLTFLIVRNLYVVIILGQFPSSYVLGVPQVSTRSRMKFSLVFIIESETKLTSTRTN